MNLNINIVNGKFVVAGTFMTYTYDNIEIKGGYKTVNIGTDLIPVTKYSYPRQKTDVIIDDNVALKFDENDYHFDSDDNDVYWKFTVENCDKIFEVVPDETIRDIVVDGISYYSCHGDKCRRTVERSVDYWCTGCHGRPNDGCSYFEVYDYLFGFPKTWGELLTSPFTLRESE